MVATPSLEGSVAIRAAANGFIVTYGGREYVFTTVQALNAWMTSVSTGS